MIQKFNQFDKKEGLNEGLISGVFNFLSKLFGGRINDLDGIVKRYERNEADYWTRWARANHDYNRASLLRDKSDDKTERKKQSEMIELSRALIRQVNRTRSQVNDALNRQAMLLVRNNRRLREYWETKLAQADERVANKSYEKLRKHVDEDTLSDLYDRLKDTQNKLKDREAGMKDYERTVQFGKFPDLSGEQKRVPFDRFGITNTSDFVLATDDLFDQRVQLMPDENKKALAGEIQKEIKSIDVETQKAVKKLNKDLDATKDEDTKIKIKTDIEKAKQYADEDTKMLQRRMSSLKGQMSEPKNVEEQPDTDTDTDEQLGRRIAEEIGDASTQELSLVLQTADHILSSMPEKERTGKMLPIRMDQIADFAQDILKSVRDRSTKGALSKSELADQLSAFKKEFPR